MSRVIQVTVGPLATANAANIGATQTPAGAGNLLLNASLVVGGVAVLDLPRHVIITSAGNDSTVTFTAYGTDWSGQPIQARVAGAAIGAADFGVSFKTVTRITTSAATASTITIGTNGVADSRPVQLDPFGFGPALVQVNVTGIANYSLRSSQDNPNDYVAATQSYLGVPNMVWIADPILTALAVSSQASYPACPLFFQLTLNSGAGSVKASITQHASPSI
jgi:hypothetical protein